MKKEKIVSLTIIIVCIALIAIAQTRYHDFLRYPTRMTEVHIIEGEGDGVIYPATGEEALPAVAWGAEGEYDGVYQCQEGEEGVAVVVDSATVGKFLTDGLHASLTGTITSSGIMADGIELTEGEGVLYPALGSAASPSIRWEDEGEADGVYYNPEGEPGVGVSVDSASVGVFEADGLHGSVTGDVTADNVTLTEGEGIVKLANGTASAPAIGWELLEGERDGFYHALEGEEGIGAAVDGSSVGKIMGTGWNGAVVGNVTGNVSGDLTGNVSGDLTGNSSGTHTGAVILPDGTVAIPALRLSSNPDTGVYTASPNYPVMFSVDNALKLTIGSALIQAEKYISCNDNPTSPICHYNINTAGGHCGMRISGTLSAPTGLTLNYLNNAVVGYNANDITLTRSAGDLEEIRTVYYESATHNQLRLRAGRGTSSAMDYLNNDDVIGSITFEPLQIVAEGEGESASWITGAAEIKAVSTENQEFGDAGTILEIYGTVKNGSTPALAARIGQYLFGEGVYDVAIPSVETTMVHFTEAGGTFGFGYFGGLISELDGVTILELSTGMAPIMIGSDGAVYQVKSGYAVAGFGTGFTVGCWRTRVNADDDFVFERYEATGEGEPENDWIVKHTITP